MRHKFEIEEEIKRVNPYTYVDDYASAWEYDEARKNRAYQSCLKCFLILLLIYYYLLYFLLLF